MTRAGTASKGQDQEQGEKLDSRIVPAMREAVAAVQLVLFGELKDKLATRFSGWDPDSYRRFIGCLVNDIFGTPALDRETVWFARENIDLLEAELRDLPSTVPELLPQLTDALRMQTLCDHEEGINSIPTLLRARAIGVLQEERSLPLPSTFMISVRRLGAEHGLLEPMQAKESFSG